MLISVSLSAERECQRIGGGNNKKGKEGMMMRRDFVSIGIYLLFEFNSSPSRGIQLEGTTFGLNSMNYGDSGSSLLVSGGGCDTSNLAIKKSYSALAIPTDRVIKF